MTNRAHQAVAAAGTWPDAHRSQSTWTTFMLNPPTSFASDALSLGGSKPQVLPLNSSLATPKLTEKQSAGH